MTMTTEPIPDHDQDQDQDQNTPRRERPIRVRRDTEAVTRRPSSDLRAGRPLGEGGLDKAQLRLLAKLSADRSRLAELRRMTQKAEAARDAHVVDAVAANVAKAVIGRALAVNPTSVLGYLRRAADS